MTEPDPLEGCDLSLVHGGPFFRLRTALHLTPRGGIPSLLIRVLALVCVAWLPVALGAVLTGRAFSGSDEPLLRHFAVHARCLVAIPLFVLGERVLRDLLPWRCSPSSRSS